AGIGGSPSGSYGSPPRDTGGWECTVVVDIDVVVVEEEDVDVVVVARWAVVVVPDDLPDACPRDGEGWSDTGYMSRTQPTNATSSRGYRASHISPAASKTSDIAEPSAKVGGDDARFSSRAP